MKPNPKPDDTKLPKTVDAIVKYLDGLETPASIKARIQRRNREYMLGQKIFGPILNSIKGGIK